MNRAWMLATPGKSIGEHQFFHSAYCDEEYLVIGSHLDENMCKKIINFEYVDFAKLLPRDKIAAEDNQRMQLINKDGMSFWVPVSDRDQTSINSFSRWESAFRVYSNVFTTQHPHKAAELIQYSHVIHTTSLTYIWDNVYLYDKEFRVHISKHPQHSWAVILQQAWNLRLREKTKRDNFHDKPKQGKSKEICKRFKCSKCHSGWSCRYEYRCTVPKCGKFGHGAHVCRLRKDSKTGNQNVQLADSGVTAPVQ